MDIKALVSGIDKFSPKPTDKILVDTNVWIWVTYSRLSQIPENEPLDYQLKKYPAFLELAGKNKTELYWCTHNIVELAGIIERTERKLYDLRHGTKISRKDFRDRLEWARVNEEIEAAVGLIKAMGKELPCSACSTDKFIEASKVYKMDSYDILILDAMQSAELNKILSDDRDYCCVKDLVIVTANDRILTAATKLDRHYERDS